MKLEKIGVLDPEGENLNPLTGKEYSKNYKFFATVGKKEDGGWSALPMYKNKEHPPESIIKDIIENKVLIIQAGTGNGKSALVPKYALHALDYQGKVVVTNPRRLPTANMAEFAAQALDVELGKEVGFQHQDSKLKSGKASKSEFTKLLFSTDGSVAEVLKKNSNGDEYDIVIVDEAHERNTRIDLILLQMKNALRINPDLKLIIMSATLPGNLFYDYYKEFKPKEIFLPAIPNFEVINHFSTRKIPKKEIENECVRLVFEEIIEQEKPGDILIFTTTLPKASEICRLITTRKCKEKILCIPLSADVEDDNIRRAATGKFDPKKLYFGETYDRKIVVGTNQVESSVTIDGVVFVIDNGLGVDISWNPETMERVIKTSVISKASAIQRAGRAGRTEPGECYKLYTEEQYKDFRPDPVLDIKKERSEELILDMFSYPNVETLLDSLDLIENLIEPPPEKFIISGIRTLAALGLISSMGGTSTITTRGKKILYTKRITKDFELGCVLAASVDYDCNWEVSAMIAMLSERKISIERLLKKPTEKKDLEKYKAKLKKYHHSSGDIMTMFKIYSKFYIEVKRKTSKLLEEFCNENFLNYNFLKRMRREHVSIYRQSEKLREYAEDVNVYDRETNIMMSFLRGYYINIAKKDSKGKKYTNWFPIQKTKGIPEDTVVSKNSMYFYYLEKSNIASSSFYKICNKISAAKFEKIKSEFVFPIEFDRRKSTKRAKIKFKTRKRRGNKNKLRKKKSKKATK